MKIPILLSIVAIVAATAAGATPGEDQVVSGTSPTFYGIRTQSESALSTHNAEAHSLLRRQNCPSGYGYCSDTGACCPLGGACCSNGHCCDRGQWCYTMGICCPNTSNGCADKGCCPKDAQCCKNGRCCPKDSYCYASRAANGAIRCCPDGKVCA